MEFEFESPYGEMAMLMAAIVFTAMTFLTILAASPKRENKENADLAVWMMTGMIAACSIGAVMLAGAIHRQDHPISAVAVHGLHLILAGWWMFQITGAAFAFLRPVSARSLPPEWGIKHHAALNAAAMGTGTLTAALSQANGWTTAQVWMGYGTVPLGIAALLLELRAMRIKK